MTTKRGRKSIGDLSVVKLSDARLLPPEHLNDAESAEWRAIVDSLPADYFRPGDIPLLGAFCSASALYKQALGMMKDDGIVIQTYARKTTKEDGTVVEDGLRQYPHPAKDILTSQAASMAQMAVKLRLCPSARYTEKSAQTKAGQSAGAARPWEDTGTE